jgi:signal transduction histidine kinase
MINAVPRWMRSRTSLDDQQVLSPAVMVFSAGVFAATVALIGLGYFATRQWLRDADLLVDRRSSEALALATSAIGRDMKGTWATLIVPMYQPTTDDGDTPYDLLQPIARTFARFPYPESFILWRADRHGEENLYVFNRTDRRPAWDNSPASNDPFPVTLLSNPAVMKDVVASLRRTASRDGFAYRNVTIADLPYQIVTHIVFSPTPPYEAVELAAFTVNMEWIRKEYFVPLLTQVARIGGNENSLAFTVSDDQGRVVAATATGGIGARGFERRFPMLFLDPALLPFAPGGRAGAAYWSVHVGPTRDNTLASALQDARRIFVLLASAGLISILSLFLAIRAIRASAVLASMKSDFVSTVTHELKTPLSLIRLVGDTLADGRYSSTDTIREYATLLSHEALRLSRTIDHLLVYAKHSTPLASQGTALTPTALSEVIEGALEQFRPTLEQREFELTIEVSNGLPRILVDPPSIILVMEILIDNAIKYSDTKKALHISARPAGRRVQITFSDRGVGIRPEDIPRVFERFYRGRNAPQGGSGLGLAIAKRIVSSHGGDIEIRSTVAVGTDVTMSLSAA